MCRYCLNQNHRETECREKKKRYGTQGWQKSTTNAHCVCVSKKKKTLTQWTVGSTVHLLPANERMKSLTSLLSGWQRSNSTSTRSVTHWASSPTSLSNLSTNSTCSQLVLLRLRQELVVPHASLHPQLAPGLLSIMTEVCRRRVPRARPLERQQDCPPERFLKPVVQKPTLRGKVTQRHLAEISVRSEPRRCLSLVQARYQHP